MEYLGNKPSNFTKERHEIFKFEEKPLEIDDFDNAEEEEFNKKKIEERKKDAKLLKKNKSLKQPKKLNEEKIEE